MESTGYIVVIARTAGGGLPLEGAYVIVRNIEGVGEIIASAYTDSSGRTDRISLPTPERGLSTTPDAKTKPYAEYTLETSLAGYVTQINTGVPIFAGVTSIQPVELIPRSLGEERPTKYDESESAQL